MSNYASDAEEYLSAQEADPAGGYDDPPTPDEYDERWIAQWHGDWRDPERLKQKQSEGRSEENPWGIEKGSSGPDIREGTGSSTDQESRSTDDDG